MVEGFAKRRMSLGLFSRLVLWEQEKVILSNNWHLGVYSLFSKSVYEVGVCNFRAWHVAYCYLSNFQYRSYVVIDPDVIRQHFPEYCLYAMKSPEHAGELTHKEAGYVTEIVTAAALQRGHNVLVDGSLWDADWYSKYFEHLRKDYVNLRIAILHITAPREAVFARAMVSSENRYILDICDCNNYSITLGFLIRVAASCKSDWQNSAQRNS